MGLSFKSKFFFFISNLVLISNIFWGCRGGDDRGHYLKFCATEKPLSADVVGLYDYEIQTLTDDELDPLLVKKCSIELKANGTFLTKHIPDESFSWAFEKYRSKRMPRDEYRKLTSEKIGSEKNVFGKWTIQEGGTIGVHGVYKTIWALNLDSDSNHSNSVKLLGNVPPYRLLIIFGDPDENKVLILKKM